MRTVGKGQKISFDVQFYLYEDGPALDPIEDGAHPKIEFYFADELRIGPIYYNNGLGNIKRLGPGTYSYELTVPIPAESGTWIARWNGGSSRILDEKFRVVLIR